jgi:beta-mannosidase
MAKAQALTVCRLSDGWTFKQADDTTEDAWLSVKTVPTNVHLDLIEHGK